MTIRYVLLALLLNAGLSRADDSWLSQLEVSGFVGADLRWFPEQTVLPEQRNENLFPSVVFKPEFQYQWNNDNDRLRLTPYLRYDAFDDNRRFFDLREAYWLHRFDNADLRIGIAEVFWGVMESRHLINIINQVDNTEDIDEEDRLGQPMINLNWFTDDWGTFELYALPGFRKRRFNDANGRFQLDTLPIAQHDAVYESSMEEAHVDFAFRWAKTLDDWDIGLSHFYGTSREARFEVETNPFGPPRQLIPHYDLIHQTSIDVQWTHDNWLWKLEALNREGNDKTFQALVGGFEYAFYGIFGTDIDFSVLAEYLWDNRSEKAPYTPFDNDVFTGIRLAFNDEQNTEVLMGSIIDVNNQASLISIEASRRVMSSWKISVDSRIFLNVTEENRALRAMRNDSFVNFQIAYFF